MSLIFPSEAEKKQSKEALKRGNKVTRAIHRRLLFRGYKAPLHTDSNKITRIGMINGVVLDYSMTETRKGSSTYYSYKSGKLAIKFGYSGGRRSAFPGKTHRFPEPKKGFNVDKIVQAIIDYVDPIVVYRESQDAAKARREKVTKVTNRLEKKYPEFSIEATSGGIRLDFRGLKPKQAEALLKAAKAAGVAD